MTHTILTVLATTAGQQYQVGNYPEEEVVHMLGIVHFRHSTGQYLKIMLAGTWEQRASALAAVLVMCTVGYGAA